MRNLLVVMALGLPGLTASANPAVIKMNSLGYDPKVITIKAGEAVQWQNVAHTEHYATADDGKTFDIGPIEPKASSQPVPFPAAGEYKYHCKIHGRTMSGTIVVK